MDEYLPQVFERVFVSRRQMQYLKSGEHIGEQTGIFDRVPAQDEKQLPTHSVTTVVSLVHRRLPAPPHVFERVSVRGRMLARVFEVVFVGGILAPYF